jgi:predicted TIM-barrel fold metal-dependent hydrolase
MGPLGGGRLPRNSPEAMARAMERAGVRLVVFCHHATLFSPEVGNRPNIEAVRRFPEHFRAYCGINPNWPDRVEADLASFEQYPDVYVGFKFLSDYHKIAVTDGRCRAVWEYADARKLLVLLHTWGGSGYDGPGPVREVAQKYPNARILMGHSCHGQWDQAVALAKDFENVYLELTAVLDDRGVLEAFVRGAGSRKILFGTDTPWFNHHYYIGAVLGADIDDEARRDIFHRNAQRLLAPWGL